MASLEAEHIPRNECWDQDELSEMMSLLQRAEQRMKNLAPTSRHPMKGTNSDKYVIAPHSRILRT